jgi:signal transduction histidine kinase
VATETPAGSTSVRLTRSRTDRVVAGVCGGLGRALGIDPFVVRVAVLVLTLLGGIGALAYVVAWLLLPREGDDQSLAAGAFSPRRFDLPSILAIGSIALGVLFILRAGGVWVGEAVVWPVLLAVVGVAVIWRQADDDDRPSLAQVMERVPRAEAATDLRSRRGSLVRVLAGVALVVVGVGMFLAASDAFSAVREGLLATTGIVGGLALITGPWWLRLGRQVTRERRERIRADERAELAAHVHDSVLHTLALIQRQADDPRAVVTMARRQERELRGWLYDGQSQPRSGDTLAAAVSQAAEEVEAVHGVSVEVVTVGDTPLDERLHALVAAAREAMVNAARWAGVATVSVYAEVTDEDVSVFVRDWGVGFDPDQVPADRHGVSDSISGRMARHRGQATVRSRPGTGTEVELRMGRQAGT